MPIPVISVAQMREWEAASWKAGRSEMDVMRRAGHAISKRAHRMLKKNESVIALYGRGKNGQDVLQACRLFVEHEIHRIEAIQPEKALEQFLEVLSLKPSLIIDGIFGIGLNRPLDDGFCKLVRAMNESNIPILAVDVPSGLDADSGRVGSDAVRASVTLTFSAPKRGLLSYDAWQYVGRLEVAAPIGLIEPPSTENWRWIVASDFANGSPKRPVDFHKGNAGHLVIVAGSLGYHGAAVLCAKAALRAQPGLVTVLTPSEIYSSVASQCQAPMVRAVRSGADLILPTKTSAVVAGPGLADPSLPPFWRETVANWWASLELPMLVDASSLDWLLTAPHQKQLQAARVITPHPGEAASLLGCSIQEVLADRETALRTLSSRLNGCWVVLKGHQTLIGRSQAPILVNSSGNAWMAQGGSGDILAGWLGGWMAQPNCTKDLESTLCFGVWKHGQVGDAIQEEGPAWTIEDFNNSDHWRSLCKESNV